MLALSAAFFLFRGLLGFGRIGNGHADDVILVMQIHAANSIRGTAHRTHIGLFEANRHTIMGGEKHDPVAISNPGGDQLVILLDTDGNDAA